MPKLTYPEDMSDLLGEEFSADPIRDNMKAISDLVNVTGLDWQNVVQWSLDHDSVYPRGIQPGDPDATKNAMSVWTGRYTNAATSGGGNPGTWTTIEPPGEQTLLNVPVGAGVFIYASIIVSLVQTGAFFSDVAQGLRIQTRLQAGSLGWNWRTLYRGYIGNSSSSGGTPSIIGAEKMTGDGTLGVRLQYWSDLPAGDLPTEWGYGNLSIFVVNQ